jgi:hypothetical protein
MDKEQREAAEKQVLLTLKGVRESEYGEDFLKYIVSLDQETYSRFKADYISVEGEGKVDPEFYRGMGFAYDNICKSLMTAADILRDKEKKAADSQGKAEQGRDAAV